MKWKLAGLAALMIFAVPFLAAWGEAPTPVKPTAPLADIVYEVNDKIEQLDTLLVTAESYEEKREAEIQRAFGVLAVMGQALAEHEDREKTGISGPALREAALPFTIETSYDDAKAILAAVKEAQSGGGATDAAVEHDWDKLVPMYPMMEEINERNAALVRVIRRPRGREGESAQASTIALLSIVMYADTHLVEGEDDVAAWQEMSDEYRTLMVQVAEAIRAQDGDTARTHFDAANETCDRCHEKFRD